MSTGTLPQLLTPMDVGHWLSLPTRQVERLARRGEIPSITLPGGELVFDAADLVEWIGHRKAEGQEVRGE
jgi:hypothetical protein